MYKELLFIPIVVAVVLVIYLYNKWDDYRATTAHTRKNKKNKV